MIELDLKEMAIRYSEIDEKGMITVIENPTNFHCQPVQYKKINNMINEKEEEE